jgi:hypothetical protein
MIMIETVRTFEHVRDLFLTVSSCLLGPELPEEFLTRVTSSRLRYRKQNKSVSGRLPFQHAEI